MTATAFEISESLAGAIASASPSIVRVNGRGHVPSTGIAWSADGLIVTAAHTIHRDERIELLFGDGATANATLIGRDESTDVALLRTDKRDLPLPQWRETKGLRVGHLVIAGGRPGRSVRATSGIVSAIGPEWRTSDGARIDARIEVDASLPPGFSGGPLLDAAGAFVGMNTSHVVRSGTTIPYATLTTVASEILAHGSTSRPLLGIAIYPVEAGLLVISVKNGSVAETAGILVGDILPVHGPRELHERIRDAQRGTSWDMQVIRGGAEKTIRVTW